MRCECEKCGWPVNMADGAPAVTINCFKCGAPVTCGEPVSLPVATGRQKLKADTWPAWAIMLQGLREEGEIGVGDTAKRIFGMVGGEQISAALKMLKLPCKCPQRQEEWNKLYKYR